EHRYWRLRFAARQQRRVLNGNRTRRNGSAGYRRNLRGRYSWDQRSIDRVLAQSLQRAERRGALGHPVFLPDQVWVVGSEWHRAQGRRQHDLYLVPLLHPLIW